MTRTHTLSLMTFLVLGGCASTHELAVDVFTDYAAGAEFDEVAVWVDDDIEHPALLTVHAHDDLADPTHIADFHEFASGYHHVIAELRHAGRPLAQGNAWVRLEESVLVPISISRRCTLTTCADNPTGATECVGGICVQPMCDPAIASCMGDQCQMTACPAPLAGECVEIICDRGTCLRLPRDELCPSVEQFCNPGRLRSSCDYLAGHMPPPLDTPVAHAASSMTTPSITVTWNDVGASGYIVELAPDPSFSTGTTMVMDATFSHTFGSGLMGGHRYYARVHATDPGAALSNVADAVTFLAPPTGLTLAVTYPGGVRNSGDCCWITPPDVSGNSYYVQAHASASCAYGSPQYAFRGGYTSPPTIYTTGWQGPDSYIVNVIDPWGAQFWVSAHCVTSDASSTATGEVRDCYKHTGTC